MIQWQRNANLLSNSISLCNTENGKTINNFDATVLIWERDIPLIVAIDFTLTIDYFQLDDSLTIDYF